MELVYIYIALSIFAIIGIVVLTVREKSESKNGQMHAGA